jgi:hypothetical protein
MKKKTEPQSYSLKSNPYLVQSLDISTGHLTRKDLTLIQEAAEGNSENPVTCYEYEYGYFVFVPPKDEDLTHRARDYGYSKQFMDILNKARTLKCKYIQYDSDGITYDDLEYYEETT